MENYYYLWLPENSKFGIVDIELPKETSTYDFEKSLYRLTDCPQFFTLKNGRSADFMTAGIFRIFSARMKSIIESYLTGREGISWIRLHVIDGQKNLDYSIPLFDNPPILYDAMKSKYINHPPDYSQDPTVPILSYKAIQDLHFFSEKFEYHRNVSKFSTGFIVSDTLRKAFKKAEINNVIFEKLPPTKFTE